MRDESGGVLPGTDVTATTTTARNRARDATLHAAPIMTVNVPTFGQVLEAADPRIMQFAVKFGF